MHNIRQRTVLSSYRAILYSLRLLYIKVAGLGSVILYFSSFSLFVAASLILYGKGFESQPLRLVVALNAWTNLEVGQHWFLYFTDPKNVEDGRPYANMPLFLGLFYGTYHAAINWLTGNLWPNATTYIVTMCVLCFASWHIVGPLINKIDCPFIRGYTLLMGSAIVTTSPFLTGYLLLTNHDNFNPLVAIFSTVLSWHIIQERREVPRFVWAALIYISACGGLFGLVVLTLCLFNSRFFSINKRVWVILYAILFFSLLYPIAISKIVFNNDASSELLFRTGLDGDISYFISHYQAFFHPGSGWRTIGQLLGMPIFALAGFYLFGWKYYWQNEDREKNPIKLLLMSTLPYTSHLIMFPQSISIHPYLYDHLIIIPLGLTILIAFARFMRFYSLANRDTSFLGFVVLITLLIHSNLLVFAQGRFKFIEPIYGTF